MCELKYSELFTCYRIIEDAGIHRHTVIHQIIPEYIVCPFTAVILTYALVTTNSLILEFYYNEFLSE